MSNNIVAFKDVKTAPKKDVPLKEKKLCIEHLNKLIQMLGNEIKSVQNDESDACIRPSYGVPESLAHIFLHEYTAQLKRAIKRLKGGLDGLYPLGWDWSNESIFVEVLNDSYLNNPKKTCVMFEHVVMWFEVEGDEVKSFTVNGSSVWQIIFNTICREAQLPESMLFFMGTGCQQITDIYLENKE